MSHFYAFLFSLLCTIQFNVGQVHHSVNNLFKVDTRKHKYIPTYTYLCKCAGVQPVSSHIVTTPYRFLFIKYMISDEYIYWFSLNNFHFSADIDDITGAQRVVLLEKSATDNTENDCCQIKVKTGLRHSTPMVSLLCDCNKIELFSGGIEEYINVFYGDLLDEFDGTKSYIFEFKFPKNITELLLKVSLTPFELVQMSKDLSTFQYSLSQTKSRFGSMAYTCTWPKYHWICFSHRST